MKMKGLLFIFILNMSNFLKIAIGGNILVVMPVCFSSHLRPFIPLVEQLIRNGHNVTVISTYPMADVQQAKYNHLEVRFNPCQMKDTADNIQRLLRINRFKSLLNFFNNIKEYSEKILNLPELQRVMHSEDHYDLVMAEMFYMDVFFAFGHKFKAPIVGLCPMNLMYFYSWILGNPYPSSYVPNQFLRYTENMSLFSRISNMIFNVFSVLYYELVHLPEVQKLMENYFNFDENNVPNIKDIMKNLSLVLVNSHYSFGYIKPELPNVINIAGLHYPSSKPLPETMKKFMEEANDGVIYVSLGTLIDLHDFQELGNTFIREQKKFPQRVIMKWDAKLLTEIPETVLVEKWIPQTQVLNHPNCRLFITHGGLHSTLESINASVPMIGIPLISDQFYNMAAADHFGIGRMIPLEEVSDRLSAEIKEVFSNPKYKENIIKRSQLFQDRLVKPLDEAMYWIEHVMKHKTANHLKPAAIHLTWYEFYAVDVLLILLAMIFSTILGMKLLMAWIFRIFHARNKNLNPSGSQMPERKDYKCD